MPNHSAASHNQALLDFINASPTPFHAVEQMAYQLEQQGFVPLLETDSWALQPQQGYYLIRGGALIAFTTGEGRFAEQGWRMVGAHTDSPCLKVKPNPIKKPGHYLQVGVEVYGGALLNPWFDRDLALAGRLSVKTAQGELAQRLININQPIATIPSLAIHLDNKANKERSINAQKDLPPIMALLHDGEDFNQWLLGEAQKMDAEIEAVLAHDLFFYDQQPARLIGVQKEFIAGARLDNLASCHIGLSALIKSQDAGQPCLLLCSDHEEVGSLSATGANGPFLQQILQRIHPDTESLQRALQRSLLISCDNAHGVHPNYSDRHDPDHGPLLNKGPVLKLNANQRYASNSESCALALLLAEQEQIPLQQFVVRSDLGCGSTIGPITAAELGVRALDIGIPTFAMHSIRELAGDQDAYALFRLLCAFNRQPALICG